MIYNLFDTILFEYPQNVREDPNPDPAGSVIIWPPGSIIKDYRYADPDPKAILRIHNTASQISLNIFLFIRVFDLKSVTCGDDCLELQ
jgi:hypothetical protein